MGMVKEQVAACSRVGIQARGPGSGFWMFHFWNILICSSFAQLPCKPQLDRARRAATKGSIFSEGVVQDPSAFSEVFRDSRTLSPPL